MPDEKRIYAVMVNPDDTKTVKIVRVAADSVKEVEVSESEDGGTLEFYQAGEKVGEFLLFDVRAWWIEPTEDSVIHQKLYDFKNDFPDPM